MVVEWKVPISARVCDIAVRRDTDQIYVATDDCVTVMDGCDIAARISVGLETKRLMLGADEAFLYVIGYDGSVRIISTADHTVTTVSGSPSATEVVSPCGRRLYTVHPATSCEGAGSWIAATAADGTRLATVAVRDYATGMDLSLSGHHLYVATSRLHSYTQYYPGAVTVVDMAQCAVVDTIAVPRSPDTVTVSPDGSQLLVTHYDTNAISAVDVERHSVRSMSLPDSPRGAAFAPDGTGAYVIGTQSLVAVDFLTQIAEIVPAGLMPRRLLFSDDGKRAYVTDLASSAIVVLDTITNSVVTVIQLDGHPETLVLSGNGERLYVADYWAGTLSAISIASALREAEAA